MEPVGLARGPQMINVITDFSSDQSKADLWQRLRSLKGKQEITVKLHRNTRSNRQNRYLFGVVYPNLAAGILEMWGESIDTETLHYEMKREFLSTPVVNEHGEEVMRRIRKSSRIDTKAFGEFSEKIIRYAGEKFGVTIPSPYEYDPEMMKEKVVNA